MRTRPGRRICFLSVAATLLAAAPARAQRCLPAETSNEADVFGIRSLSLAMGRGTAIGAEPAGTVRIGAEAVFLPRIDDETARPTTCRPGKESENVNALLAAGRLRVAVSLPRTLTLELAWLPPLEIHGMRANLFGFGLGGSRSLSSRWVLGARAHATIGHVTGPFTCPGDATRDAESECFGGTISDDRFEPNILGADVSVGFNPATSAFAWFGGMGYSRLQPRFQVQFRNQAGMLDSTRVDVDLHRLAVFGGVTRVIGSRFRVSGELYATTRDGATGRLIVDALVRRGN
jgi:hypothetical protein